MQKWYPYSWENDRKSTHTICFYGVDGSTRFTFDSKEERDTYWDMLDKITCYAFNFEKEWDSVKKTLKSD